MENLGKVNMAKKLISIVIPIYNEECCVVELAQRLQRVFAAESKYDFEVIAVENGSSDQSFELLKQVRHADSRFKVLQLSRNFGADGGVTAGLTCANGDACVIIMADLQEPPELISEMLRKWEEGFENIYGLVTKRGGSGVIRRINSQIFYKVAGVLTGNVVTANASDFRLVDRKVYKAVLRLDERNRFVRGLFSWVGFRSVGVPFERPPRFGGRSKAHTRTVLSLALRGILSNSFAPLRLITILGVLAATTALIVLGSFAVLFFTHGVPFDGFGTLVGLNLLGFAFLALFMGALGEYLALTYEETKRRPNFIVSHAEGLEIGD